MCLFGVFLLLLAISVSRISSLITGRSDHSCWKANLLSAFALFFVLSVVYQTNLDFTNDCVRSWNSPLPPAIAGPIVWRVERSTPSIGREQISRREAASHYSELAVQLIPWQRFHQKWFLELAHFRDCHPSKTVGVNRLKVVGSRPTNRMFRPDAIMNFNEIQEYGCWTI